jgi:hypothetical protein
LDEDPEEGDRPMSKHAYRLSLTPLDPASSEIAAEALHVEIESHDNIIETVARLRARPDLDADEAAALGLGLKSLGWVLLRQKKAPLYAGFLGQLSAFIKSLKTA